MNKKALFCIRVRDSDPLGRRCGAVARAARACRRCDWGTLQYSPTAQICAGTLQIMSQGFFLMLITVFRSDYMAYDAKINYINDVKRENYGVCRKHTTDIP